jgi:hypothetical protein
LDPSSIGSSYSWLFGWSHCLSFLAGLEICEKTKELLMRESNVVHISAPVTVVGDIHGWAGFRFLARFFITWLHKLFLTAQLWPKILRFWLNKYIIMELFSIMFNFIVKVFHATLFWRSFIWFIKTVLRLDRNLSDRRVLSRYKLFILGWVLLLFIFFKFAWWYLSLLLYFVCLFCSQVITLIGDYSV